tara:strand:+ start:3527 stop:4249 length:723 start_codon:yes stop_codon:yes gene_type:complete
MILPYKGSCVYDIKMAKLSELTDSIVSTLFVILFWALSLGLNETTYEGTDLSKRLPTGNVQCAFVNPSSAMETTSYDPRDEGARELLYGTFSARGASIAVIVLGVLALVLGLLKYSKLSLCGFHLELFNYVVTGALLSATVGVFQTHGALLHQHTIPSANVADGILSLDACKDAEHEVIPNVLDRATRLRASLIFGLLTVLSIMYMARELREYMTPAKNNDQEPDAVKLISREVAGNIVV